MDAAMEEARLKRTRKLGEGLVAMCVCVCVCVFRPSWIIQRHAWRQLELGCCKLETAVCVLIKSNETNLRSIMRPLEWYGNASCRPRSIKLRIATRYPSSTNVTGFQPPPPLSASVSYSRYFIERSIEKDFQRVTLRFLCEGTIDDCQ